MAESMSKMELDISFNTPAFLGNAEQQGQWRTPPFKALIRQWWRVVKSSQGCSLDDIRNEESILFGAASDKNPSVSKIKLKLARWNAGNNDSTPFCFGKIMHPEVRQGMIESSLYLGYGPVSINGVKQHIPENAVNKLILLFPEKYENELIETIKLINYFGTIGSRSRNGWGSLNIDSVKLNGKERLLNSELSFSQINAYSEDFKELMRNDWPKALGKDANGVLIWKTTEKLNYKEVLKDLADIKVKLRTNFKFTDGKDALRPSYRHILAYPVTNHNIKSIDRDARNSNQLRFKVLKNASGKYYGLVFHLPCCVSDVFFKHSQSIKSSYRELEKSVWPILHAFLDSEKCNCCRLK